MHHTRQYLAIVIVVGRNLLNLTTKAAVHDYENSCIETCLYYFNVAQCMLRQFCASFVGALRQPIYSTMPVAVSTYLLVLHQYIQNQQPPIIYPMMACVCFVITLIVIVALKSYGLRNHFQCVNRKEIYERNPNYPQTIKTKRSLNFPSLCNPDFRSALFGASLCPN